MPTLAPPPPAAAALDPPTPPPATSTTTVLVQLLHRLLDMRHADTDAAAELAGLPPLRLRPAHPDDGDESPFRLADLPAADPGAAAGRLLERAMLVKAVTIPWGTGPTLADAVADAVAAGAAAKAAAVGAPWRATIDAHGRNLDPTSVAAALQALTPITSHFTGPVSLASPDFTLRVTMVGGRACDGEATLPRSAPRVVIGAQLGRGRAAARAALAASALTARPYIGPTSMDPEVALVMANLALVRPGSLVLDPCAGTGSIPLAAAARGGWCVGADIDAAALWGRPAARAARKRGGVGVDAAAVGATGARVTATGGARYAPGAAGSAAAAAAAKGATAGVADNFAAAALAPAAFLVADMGRLPLTRGPARGGLDAIIADPPYGVRAGGRTQAHGPDAPPTPATPAPAAKRKPARAGTRFRVDGGIAPTKPYSLADCLDDLLRGAARALRPGGRLVYFLPTIAGDIPANHVPTHPDLRLVTVCEQPLTRWYSRRLVVMEKVGEGVDETLEAAHAASGANAPAYEAAAAVAAGVYGGFAEGGSQGCVRRGRSKTT